jgi:hypothetical protein
MSETTQADIRHTKQYSIWLIFAYALLFALGIHLGQLATLLYPWPDNMSSLLLSAPLSWTVLRRLGMALPVILLSLQLASVPAFATPASLKAKLLNSLKLAGKRHLVVAISLLVFSLPFAMIGGLFLAVVLAASALLVCCGPLLVNHGVAGRTTLALLWLAAGWLGSDALARSYRDVDLECRAGAEIAFKTGARLPCTSIQSLDIYKGVLIRDEAK